MKVVFNKTKKKRVVISVVVKVGLINEEPEHIGISHFLEHILWESTISKSGKEIRDAVRDMHGEYNASTSNDTTKYYIEVPRKHLNKAIELLAGVITKPQLNNEDIEKERTIILNELTRYDDHPFYGVDKTARATLFEGNMLQNEVIGTVDTIKRINRELLEQHYAKYYASNNMAIAISGDVDDPTQKIEKLFDLQPKFIQTPKKFEAKAILPKSISAKGNSKATYVELAFLTVDYRKKESDNLEVIAELLEDGKELSLTEEVRFNHGLTYNVHVYSHGLRETGRFVVGLSTENNKTQEALTLIRKQIDKIQQVSKKEVEEAKRRILKNLKEIIKDQELFTDILADSALFDSWSEFENKEKKIKAVTIDDVKSTAKAYLTNNHVEVILQQKEEKPA